MSGLKHIWAFYRDGFRSMTVGANLSALWILVANAWMQNPVGTAFNPATREF